MSKLSKVEDDVVGLLLLLVLVGVAVAAYYALNASQKFREMVDRNLYRVRERIDLPGGYSMPTGLSANWIYQHFGTGFSEGTNADEYEQALAAQGGLGVWNDDAEQL